MKVEKETKANEMRCMNCNRMLGKLKGEGIVEIKCPKCGEFNHFKN